MTSHNNEENGAADVNHAQDTFYENLFGINSSAAPPTKSESGIQTKSNHPGQDPDVSFHVQHCARCINARQCQRGVANARSSSCPIVPCRLGCLHSFHACKAPEHEDLLCPRATVPCINAQHGCPQEMERRWTGVHLQTCPASVIVCTVEWNRKPLAPWQSEHFEKWAANDKDLDIAATRQDEQTVKEYYKRLPQSLRSLLRTNDKKQAIMPLGVAGTRIPKSILAQTAVEKFALTQAKALIEAPICSSSSASVSSSSSKSKQNSSEASASSDSGDEDDDSSLISYSEPSYGIRKSPSAGLQQSVCSQLTAPASATSASVPSASASRSKRKSRVRLSPTVDVVVKDACKYMNLFTFMCAHEFRRDEYAAHFRNVHTEIVTQLNGWLWTRCPMALQGCDYGVERMFPAGDRDGEDNAALQYEIVRNEALDTFCVRQISDEEGIATANDVDVENISATDKTEENEDSEGESANVNANVPLSICDLPVEVLVHLTKYLDPLSLNALTMTNKLFLSVCQLIAVERGIVVLDWEKGEDEKGAVATAAEEYSSSPHSSIGWRAVCHRWMFSTHFTPIRRWQFLEPGAMSNHMATCPVLAAQRHRPSAPFCYPVTKDNL